MIIGINGKKGCGKDTWASFFIQASSGYFSTEFTKLSFAQPIKDFVVNTVGCTYEEIEDREFKESELPKLFQNPELGIITYRHLMQKFGTECVRDNLHKEYWVNTLLSKVTTYAFGAANNAGDHIITKTSNHVVTDMRFENEFDAISKLGGYTVRIDRGVSGDGHISEKDLDREYDLIIENVGSLDDLRRTAVDLVEHLRLLGAPL